MARVSLKDIAQQANVSISLVSRVLRNNMGNVTASDELKKKIVKTAETLGYIPDKRARSLKTGKSGLIAVVLPIAENFAVSVYPELLRGIMEESRLYGFDFIYRYFSGLDNSEVETLKYIVNTHVDGLIYSPSLLTPLSEERKTLFKEITDEGVKTIFCCEKYDIENTCSICVDDIAGAKMAVNILLEEGAQEITYFFTIIERRLEAVKEVCHEHGISLHIVECQDFSAESARKSAEEYLKNNTPKFILASCDVQAIAIRSVCSKHNITPMIIGFDGLRFINLLEAPFPSIYQPTYEIGRMSVQNLMLWLEGKPIDKNITLQPRIVCS